MSNIANGLERRRAREEDKLGDTNTYVAGGVP
jgi:hypothetical protein